MSPVRNAASGRRSRLAAPADRQAGDDRRSRDPGPRGHAHAGGRGHEAEGDPAHTHRGGRHAGGPAGRGGPQAGAALGALGLPGGVQPRDGRDAGLPHHDPEPDHGPRGHAPGRGGAGAPQHEVRGAAGRARRAAGGDPHRHRHPPLPGRPSRPRRLTALEDADVVTSSAAYARRFAGPVGAWFLEVQARITLDLLRLWPGASVLDVGGGHGQLLGPLLEAGHDVTVYGSAEVCRERIQDRLDGARARFEAGDLLRSRWPDRAFDVVVCYRLLPHVAAWPELVGELCRLARRAVLVDYPTRRSVNAAAEPLFAAKKGVEGDTRPFAV